MTDWAWNQDCEKGTSKIVLLYLAQCHNAKTGLCNPSTRTIAQATNLNIKTVSPAIKNLEKLGLILVDRKEKTNSKYFLNCAQNGVQKVDETEGDLSPKTDTESVPENGGIPENGLCPKTDSSVPENGQACTQKRVHNQELIRKESGNNKNNRKKELDFSSWPGMPSEQVWDDYKKLRQKKRAPLTQTVINSLGNNLRILAAKGYEVDAVLSICCERGWQGLQADWILKNQNFAGMNTSREPTELDIRREAMCLQGYDRVCDDVQEKPLEEYFEQARENLLNGTA